MDRDPAIARHSSRPESFSGDFTWAAASILLRARACRLPSPAFMSLPTAELQLFASPFKATFVSICTSSSAPAKLVGTAQMVSPGGAAHPIEGQKVQNTIGLAVKLEHHTNCQWSCRVLRYACLIVG